MKYVSSTFWISQNPDSGGEPLYRAAAARLARFWDTREPAGRIRARMLHLRAH